MAEALRAATAKRSVPTRRAKASLAERDLFVLFFTFATPVRVGWIAPETISCGSLACQTMNAHNFRFTQKCRLVVISQMFRGCEIDFCLNQVDECESTLVLNRRWPLLPSEQVDSSSWLRQEYLLHTSFIESGFHFTTSPRSMLRLLNSAAPAARKPNTASSTTGFRVRTDEKKLLKWS